MRPMPTATMDEDGAREMLALLSPEFGVPPPRLRWIMGARAWYYYNLREIRVGPNSWGGVENCVIHEFAHHVAQSLDGNYGHRGRFFEYLCEVARVWYGDESRYGWSYEYKSLQKRAASCGMTRKRGQHDSLHVIRQTGERSTCAA